MKLNYKIGDKVETPLGIGKLVDISQNNETKFKVAYGTRTTWYAHDEVEPYTTAHEKLLALGWGVLRDNTTHVEFRKTIRKDSYIDNYSIIKVTKKSKTFSGQTYYNDNFVSRYSQYELSFDLELARIMLQYLEEME